MTLAFRHPSTPKLQRWLDRGESNTVAEHVEQCDRCADRLVELDAVDETYPAAVDSDPSLANRVSDALSALYRAPDDINERVFRGIQKRSKAEREFSLVAGLFVVGVDTAKLIAAPEDEDPSGYSR